MNSIAKYSLGYLVIHILLISIVQSYFCQDLKMLELALIFVAFGFAVFNSKKITLDKSDIIIAFLLISFNIYYTFIESRGLIFFKMTYVLLLALIVSKVILPNISLKKYFGKINTIYFIVLAFLVIEYLVLAFFGDWFLVDLFMCDGEKTGVRGYIELYNITKEILPFHITGLNSIMMGGQTASQLSVIIFIWCLYKYKDSEKIKHLALGLLAIFMIFLSPSLTSFFLLFISIVIIYFIHLKSILNEQINLYKVYLDLFIGILLIYLLFKVILTKYPSFNHIYDEFIIETVIGFSYFNLKELLFGISYERELELFGVGEISYLDQLMTYGLLGIGLFYISIFYYILRALGNKNTMLLVPNIFIIVIFVLGNAHYPVMFNLGVMELFVLHLAYIIYLGAGVKKN